jgi:hypothetical protein
MPALTSTADPRDLGECIVAPGFQRSGHRRITRQLPVKGMLIDTKQASRASCPTSFCEFRRSLVEMHFSGADF